MNLFLILFLFFLIFYILLYLSYYIFGKVYGDVQKLFKYNVENFFPSISLIVPTFNEEKIIDEKIKNLFDINYPPEKMEIIFMDCSTDGTTNKIKDFQKTSTCKINLVHDSKREGLSEALNRGYSMATGEIVIKSDADIIMEPDSVTEIVKFLGNNDVAGVSGIGLTDSNFDNTYGKVQVNLRIAESNFYSTYLFDTFCAFKKELIDPIRKDSAADDAEVAINLIRKGYKTLVNPNAKFHGRSTKKFSERRKQKDRRAEGHIRLILQNADMLFNKKYGKFGLFIFPMIFWMMILTPWFSILLLILLFSVIWVMMGFVYLLIGILLIISIIIVSYKFLFLSRLGVFIDSQLSLILAQFKVISGKKTYKWEKVER